MSMRTDFRIESLLGDLKHGKPDGRHADAIEAAQVNDIAARFFASRDATPAPSADTHFTQ